MKNKNKTFKVALTGGGTAGHVMPHVALLPHFMKMGWSVFYIGSSGVEKRLIKNMEIPFFEIAAGKLRRYFSWSNFIDIFRVLLGILQSLFILMKAKPDIVFSKGGFVSVPVAVAAWILRIPVVSHESDLTPGLANRIIARFADRLLYSFPETESLLTHNRTTLVGLPVRDSLRDGCSEKGNEICGFEDNGLPVILFMGGSLGAQRINNVVLESLHMLVQKYRVIHIVGPGKNTQIDSENYVQFEFMSEDLNHVLAISDVVVCRAGANTIFELLSLRKPMILVPLEKGSRGDQVDNARCFQRHGWATLILENDLSGERLLKEIESSLSGSEKIISDIESAFDEESPENKILRVLQDVM